MLRLTPIGWALPIQACHDYVDHSGLIRSLRAAQRRLKSFLAELSLLDLVKEQVESFLSPMPAGHLGKPNKNVIDRVDWAFLRALLTIRLILTGFWQGMSLVGAHPKKDSQCGELVRPLAPVGRPSLVERGHPLENHQALTVARAPQGPLNRWSLDLILDDFLEEKVDGYIVRVPTPSLVDPLEQGFASLGRLSRLDKSLSLHEIHVGTIGSFDQSLTGERLYKGLRPDGNRRPRVGNP